MTDTPEKHDLEAEKRRADEEWWEGWWREDYSWKGLKTKLWQGWSVLERERLVVETAQAPEGARAATLQDYWRQIPGSDQWRSDEQMSDWLQKLSDGPVFHRAHRPTNDKHGKHISAGNWKINRHSGAWAEVQQEIETRLSRAELSPSEYLDTSVVDRRCRLDGAILRNLLPPRPRSEGVADSNYSLELSARWMRILSEVDFQNTRFEGDTDFERMVVQGRADLRDASFQGGVNLEFAVFQGGADFREANFKRNARFTAAKFQDYADFQAAKFFHGAQFNGADFRSFADFLRASFTDKADFYRANFLGLANFASATFDRNTVFELATFQDIVSFRGTRFRDMARFTSAKFHDHTGFQSASFDHSSDFESARFEEVADFQGASFQSDTILRGVVFGKQADFRDLNSTAPKGETEAIAEADDNARIDFTGSRFLDRSEWLNARFPGEAIFTDVIFEDDCLFGQAKQSVRSADGFVQPGARFLGNTSFRNALFKRTADFARCRFPNKAEDRNGVFEGCRFNEVLDLKGVERLPFSAFQGIRLDQGLSLDPNHPVEEQFQDALNDARDAATRDTETRDAADYDKNKDADRERRGADARFAALEAGCRVLKTQMARDEDKTREQKFFRMELLARDRRPTTSRTVRGFSRAYGLLSNYGGSVMLPLYWLSRMTLGVFAVYLLMTLLLHFTGVNSDIADLCWGQNCAPQLHPFIAELIEAVAKGALGPFRILAGRGEVFGYLTESAPVFRGFILVGMLLHGLIASALIFLALLALRRNFQIN